MSVVSFVFSTMLEGWWIMSFLEVLECSWYWWVDDMDIVSGLFGGGGDFC